MTNGAQDPEPSAALDPVVVATRRTRSLVQRTEPRHDLADTIGLVDEMTAMARSHAQVFRAVERLTGLAYGELQVLGAVAEGADHPRAVARATGQTEAAAAVTVDGLVSQGLLARHHDPRAPKGSAEPGLVHVTGSGTVLVQQAEALRYRLVDALVDSLDEQEADELRGAVERAAAVFDLRAPAPPELISPVADAS